MSAVGIGVLISCPMIFCFWWVALNLYAYNMPCEVHPEGHPFNWRALVWSGLYLDWLDREYGYTRFVDYRDSLDDWGD